VRWRMSYGSDVEAPFFPNSILVIAQATALNSACAPLSFSGKRGGRAYSFFDFFSRRDVSRRHEPAVFFFAEREGLP